MDCVLCGATIVDEVVEPVKTKRGVICVECYEELTLVAVRSDPSVTTATIEKLAIAIDRPYCLLPVRRVLKHEQDPTGCAWWSIVLGKGSELLLAAGCYGAFYGIRDEAGRTFRPQELQDGDLIWVDVVAARADNSLVWRSQ